MRWAMASLADAPALNHAALKAKGFGDEQIAKIESGLASAFDIKFVFNKWTLGEDFCRNVLKISRCAAERLRLRHAEPSSASPRPTSTRPTSMSAGR